MPQTQREHTKTTEIMLEEILESKNVEYHCTIKELIELFKSIGLTFDSEIKLSSKRYLEVTMNYKKYSPDVYESARYDLEQALLTAQKEG